MNVKNSKLEYEDKTWLFPFETISSTEELARIKFLLRGWDIKHGNPIDKQEEIIEEWNNLSYEAKLEWADALIINPKDKEAIKKLRLQNDNSNTTKRLYTKLRTNPRTKRILKKRTLDHIYNLRSRQDEVLCESKPSTRGSYKIVDAETRKKAVFEALEEGVDIIAKKYKIRKKSLKRWLQIGPEKKKGGGRKPAEGDKDIYKFALQHIKDNLSIPTNRQLRNEAIKFGMKGSKGWLAKFHGRYLTKFQHTLTAIKNSNIRVKTEETDDSNREPLFNRTSFAKQECVFNDNFRENKMATAKAILNSSKAKNYIKMIKKET